MVSLGPQPAVGGCLRDDARQLRQRAHPDTLGALLGILTERDLMTRVLAKALNPQTALVGDVMTPHPQTVPPDMKVSGRC